MISYPIQILAVIVELKIMFLFVWLIIILKQHCFTFCTLKCRFDHFPFFFFNRNHMNSNDNVSKITFNQLFTCDQVYDGTNANSTELMRHCGNSLPSPSIYRSSGQYMYVKMRSDVSLSGRGFKAQYVTGRCPVICNIKPKINFICFVSIVCYYRNGFLNL